MDLADCTVYPPSGRWSGVPARQRHHPPRYQAGKPPTRFVIQISSADGAGGEGEIKIADFGWSVRMETDLYVTGRREADGQATDTSWDIELRCARDDHGPSVRERCGHLGKL
jgi:hypothetical protein